MIEAKSFKVSIPMPESSFFIKWSDTSLFDETDDEKPFFGVECVTTCCGSQLASYPYCIPLVLDCGGVLR